MTTLSRAIGRASAALQGLRCIILPDGLDSDAAVAISEAANRARSASDFSFVLADEGSDPKPGYLLPGNEVGFRVGDRLMVVPRRTTTLVESVSGAYTPALGPDFPSADGSQLGVDSLADSAADLLLAGRSPDETQRTLSRAIATAMGYLAVAYEQLGDDDIVWNAAWFRHCDAALDTLTERIGDLGGRPEEDLLVATYASFCLPIPNDLRSDRPYGGVGKGPADYARRLVDGWFTADDVLSTVAFLPPTPDGEPHPVSALDWISLPKEIRAQRHRLLGLASLDRADDRFATGWAALEEAHFFAPRGDGAGSILRITDANGAALPRLSDRHPDSLIPPLAPAASGGFTSSTVQVRVPIVSDVGGVTRSVVDETGLAITTAPKALQFVEEDRFLDGGELVLQGRFELQMARTKPVKWPTTKKVARLQVPKSDPLIGHIDLRASGSFFILPDAMEVGLALEVKPGGRLGHVHYVGPEYIDLGSGPAPNDDPIVFSQDVDHVAIAFPDTEAGYEGNRPVPIGAGWSLIHATPIDGGVLQLGSIKYRTELAAPDLHIESPLLAAALKARVSTSPPTSRIRESLRGRYEEGVGAAILDDDPLPTLGRWFLSSSDTSQRMDQREVAPGGGFLIDAGFADDWRLFDGPELTRSVVESPEARALGEAFDALNLRDLLGLTRGDEAPRTISRTSLAKLYGTQELDAYLMAYSDLVDLALRGGTGATAMWAAYPFSITVWKTTAAATLQSVLLSPFHPLRLHWLASTEMVLRGATAAKAFLPVIEGWNFPALGPSSGGGNTRVMAVPADNGEGQVFAGWSMLVRVSSEEPSALDIPGRAGQYPLPGMSSSGLNEGGVRSAVRDFRRMNPWRSTISLDLAATHPGPRLTEIDQAVVDEATIWAKDQNEGLPGGVRVFDSMKRYGDLPELGDIGRRLGAPLVWKRYEGEHAPEDVDIRLMQDSPASFRSKSTNGPEYSVAIDMPLRRYEVRAGHPSGTHASRPQLGSHPVGEHEEAFFGALAAVEGSIPGEVTEIEARVNAQLLVAGGAEWTITGEFNSDPATLAAAIPAQDAGEFMLWEWRPPFLQTGDTTSLERRAYVAFARIPKAFRDLLALKIAEWSPDDASASEHMATTVMKVLGQRGIGLSSLITTGGTRLTGAIGFYTCLELHSGAPGEYMLPIDICAPFLTAISGASIGEERRRADLLLLRLTDEGVDFVPVEIKVRKEAVPGPDAAVLRDPLQQLADTTNALRRLVGVWNEPEDQMSHKLRAVGLAALIETAIGLSGVTDEPLAALQRDRLAAVASGAAKVRLGNPLLVYLPIGADLGDDGVLRDVPTTTLVDGIGRHIQFLVDPIKLMSNIDGCPSRKTWQAAVDLAFGDAQATEGKPSDEPHQPLPRPRPEPVPIDTNGGEIPPPREEEGLAGTGIRFAVGTFMDGVGDTEAEFWPSNTALNQLNVGVVGDLGTGKTQLLKGLILSLRRASHETQGVPLPMLILDYKKDFQDADFVDRVGARVIAPHKIPLNIFQLPDGYSGPAAYKRAKSFADTLRRIYAGVGPVQFNRLATAITSLFQELDPRVPTIYDVADKYRALAGADDAVVSILNNFTLGEIFQGDGEMVTFEDLLGDQVLVVDLHALGADQYSKHALVAFFLDLYYEYMYSRAKRPYQGDDPQLRWLSSYLLVDEASNILGYEFDSLRQILLEGREFGVGVMLSTQFLSHFKTAHENWAEPLRTWFIHRVPGLKGSDLVKIGATLSPEDRAKRVGDLKVHEALYVGLNVNGRLIRGIPYWQLTKGE